LLYFSSLDITLWSWHVLWATRYIRTCW